MIYRYVCPSRVAKIEERFHRIHRSGAGNDEVFDKISTGWWVVSDGPSPIAMQAGPEKPPFKIGAALDIVLEIKE